MGDPETSMYGFAGAILLISLIVHRRRGKTYGLTSLVIATAGLLALLAGPWNGVWNDQELWGVGAVIAFVFFLAASGVAAMIVKLSRRRQ